MHIDGVSEPRDSKIIGIYAALHFVKQNGGISASKLLDMQGGYELGGLHFNWSSHWMAGFLEQVEVEDVIDKNERIEYLTFCVGV